MLQEKFVLFFFKEIRLECTDLGSSNPKAFPITFRVVALGVAMQTLPQKQVFYALTGIQAQGRFAAKVCVRALES